MTSAELHTPAAPSSVRIPPGFLGLCLLLWGGLTAQLPMAIALAAALELRFVTDRRLATDARSFVLAMDLCLLCIAGAVVYLFFTPRTESIARILLRWGPMLLAPLAIVHAWSEQPGAVYLSRLFHTFKRHRGAPSGPKLDLTLGYAAFCLIAAGVGNLPGLLFFGGMSCCLAWFLWWNRPRRHHAVLWIVLLGMALGLGYVGQDALVDIQERARNWQRRWMQDPFRSQTGIGDVETVKFSQRIALRVAVPPEQEGVPMLLLEAAYDFFGNAQWQATEAGFTHLQPIPQENVTPPADYLLPGSDALLPKIATLEPNATRYTIYQYFRRAQGLLTLPLGAQWVEGAPAERITGNRMGAVKVENVPGMLGYSALQSGTATHGRLRPPTPLDTLVPPVERAPLEAVLASLELDGLPPDAQAGGLLRFFHNEFRYSLTPQRTRTDMRPLEEFLMERKSGHCEYFASAATLMLRQLGVPARYATGFSVQEWDPASKLFVVRESHAHAWTLFWLDGRWQAIDPTPPNWLALEADNIPLWQGMADSVSALFFRFSKWRWLSQDKGVRQALLAVAICLGVFLVYRLWKRGGLQKRTAPEAVSDVLVGPGLDSPFYQVLGALEDMAGPRPPAEPLRKWLRRLGHEAALPLLELHYRQRFDPEGLDPAGRRQLDAGVAQWLTETRTTNHPASRP